MEDEIIVATLLDLEDSYPDKSLPWIVAMTADRCGCDESDVYSALWEEEQIVS